MRWWTIEIRFFFHSYTIKFRHISMIIISRSHWHTTRPTEKKKFVDYSYIHKFLTQTKNCDVCRWMNINEKKKKKKWKYTTNERTNDWIVLLVSVAGTTANSSSSTDLVYCVAEFGGGVVGKTLRTIFQSNVLRVFNYMSKRLHAWQKKEMCKNDLRFFTDHANEYETRFILFCSPNDRVWDDLESQNHVLNICFFSFCGFYHQE